MRKMIDGVTVEVSAEEEAKIRAEWAVEDENERRIGYIERRLKEYPKISDQLDSLWHAMDKGILTKVPEFYDPIKATKTKHPKPKGAV